MNRSLKILGIQFKYFGDAVLMIPALRAIREHWPDCALHVLAAEEVVPVLNHLPWLNRVWAMPRTRGSPRFKQTWPIIRALRNQRFDRSVDFGGNDRGAILSLLSGARQRLGPIYSGGFLGRRFCYNQPMPPPDLRQHEGLRNLKILAAWGISPERPLETEIHTDAAADAFARTVLPERMIICHLAAGQPKKEWPARHWAALYQLAVAAGLRLVFTTGTRSREQALLQDLKKLAPAAPVLPPVPDLAAFLAVLKRAEVFIAGDTGPLHFAAGLGAPTIALFGPTSAVQWAPVGRRQQTLVGGRCSCNGHLDACQSASHCLAAISPEEVFQRLRKCTAAVSES